MCISIHICTYKSTCFVVPGKGYCNDPIAFYELQIEFKPGDRWVSSQEGPVVLHFCHLSSMFGGGLIFLFFLPPEKFLVKLLKVIKIQSPGETYPSKSPTVETEERKLLRYHSIGGLWLELDLQLKSTGPCPLGAELWNFRQWPEQYFSLPTIQVKSN